MIKEKFEIQLESNNLKLEKAKEKLKKYEEVQDKIKKNNEIDAQLIKANLRIDELIGEKRGYEKIKVENQVNIGNLKNRIEKNNEIITKIKIQYIFCYFNFLLYTLCINRALIECLRSGDIGRDSKSFIIFLICDSFL